MSKGRGGGRTCRRFAAWPADEQKEKNKMEGTERKARERGKDEWRKGDTAKGASSGEAVRQQTRMLGKSSG